LLRSISATGVAPRTVNKARQLVCAIFNYGTRPSTFALPATPARHADRRREPDTATLAFYSPEQIETLASALAAGAHRDASRPALGSGEILARAREDAQDADLIRVAAYAGLRRGELVVLRWRDVDFSGRKLIVRRVLSGETEVRSTKSRRAGQVPLPDQAATALERLRQRGESQAWTTTCPPADSVGGSTHQLSGAASNAPVMPPAWSFFAITVFATPTASCSSLAASTCQA
jgi:integrase